MTPERTLCTLLADKVLILFIYDHLRTIRLIRLIQKEQTQFYLVIAINQKEVLQLLGGIQVHKCRLVKPYRNLALRSTNSGSNLHRLHSYPSKEFNEAQAFVHTTGEELGPFYLLKSLLQ